MEPELGEYVFIRPRNGLEVQYEHIHGRWLPPEGQEVAWSVWWHKRYRDGAIEIILTNKVEE